MKIGILGGGVTGLALGYFLQKKGIGFEVLEKDSVAGGLCRSFSEQGFTFDTHGPHIIFSKDKEILDFVLDLLGENKVKNKRNAKVLFKGRFVKYPFENGLSDLPLEDNFECLNEFVKTFSAEKREPKNFEEWMYLTFGKGITEKYLLPYNKKIWNFPPSKMATFWVYPRIPKPPAEDIIKASLGIETEGYTHQLFFYYPRNGGFQAITDALEEKIRGKVTKNFEVKSVEKRKGKCVVSNGVQEKEFDKIVSTLPIYGLQKAIPEIPEKISKAISALKYNSLVTIFIGMKKGKVTDKHWLYIPDSAFKGHRVIFPKNYSPMTAPEGLFSVGAEITFNEGDEVSKAPDKKLVEHVVEYLDKQQLIDKSDVIYSKAFRTKFAYVVYDLDYEKNIAAIRGYFEKELGIPLCGRFAEFQYINSDACIRHAKDLSERIA